MCNLLRHSARVKSAHRDTASNDCFSISAGKVGATHHKTRKEHSRIWIVLSRVRKTAFRYGCLDPFRLHHRLESITGCLIFWEVNGRRDDMSDFFDRNFVSGGVSWSPMSAMFFQSLCKLSDGKYGERSQTTDLLTASASSNPISSVSKT